MAFSPMNVGGSGHWTVAFKHAEASYAPSTSTGSAQSVTYTMPNGGYVIAYVRNGHDNGSGMSRYIQIDGVNVVSVSNKAGSNTYTSEYLPAGTVVKVYSKPATVGTTSSKIVATSISAALNLDD